MPTSAVDLAVELADLLEARISALAFEIEFYVPQNFLTDALLDIPQMIATERTKNAANARNLVNAFEAAASRRGLSRHRIIERATTGEIPTSVTEYARLHDLTILPTTEYPAFQQYVTESVIFGSGRPVLVMPAAAATARSFRLDRIGVAWDFSRAAARALADAIPLLQSAKMVRVFTITHEKAIGTGRSGAELERHLSLYDVEPILDEADAAGRTIGGALQAYAADHNLDILVMGAYGHSRMREFILGGATKSIIEGPSLPVFLSH
jgi:nucleotide-binding universal stress UspA family protein